MSAGTCMFCGGACFHRVEAHDDCATEFAAGLGAAIAAFARRARVAELVECAVFSVDEMGGEAGHRGRAMTRPCWHDRFHPTREPCAKPARWRGPREGEDARGSEFTSLTEWCDEHRHAIDVPLLATEGGAER